MKYLLTLILYLVGIAIPVGIGALLTLWAGNRKNNKQISLLEIDYDSLDLT